MISDNACVVVDQAGNEDQWFDPYSDEACDRALEIGGKILKANTEPVVVLADYTEPGFAESRDTFVRMIAGLMADEIDDGYVACLMLPWHELEAGNGYLAQVGCPTGENLSDSARTMANDVAERVSDLLGRVKTADDLPPEHILRAVYSGLLGRTVIDSTDDAPVPTVGKVVGQIDAETVLVVWDGSDQVRPEAFDQLTPR